ADHPENVQRGQALGSFVQPYIVRRLGNGITVAIVGLTVAMVTRRMTARMISASLFDDPVQTGAELAGQVRTVAGADLVVALTHIGLSQDRKLAGAAPGIDVILGGHSHSTLPEGERVGDTLICHTGAFGHHVGVVELQRDDSGVWNAACRLETL
ncbi:MAG TPA: hypothetical protein VGS41_00420, partial [Chthonomonadales bacterium]|nr:hypothetical protein [Chthonomonadales bacterium]